MRKNDLIYNLNLIEGNPEVLLFDVRKNLHNASDEPTGQGLYAKYEVSLEGTNTNQFITISFDNDDYKSDGTPDAGASIYSTINNEIKG